MFGLRGGGHDVKDDDNDEELVGIWVTKVCSVRRNGLQM